MIIHVHVTAASDYLKYKNNSNIQSFIKKCPCYVIDLLLRFCFIDTESKTGAIRVCRMNEQVFGCYDTCHRQCGGEYPSIILRMLFMKLGIDVSKQC